MVAPVAIEFRITGPGWADLEFRIGDKAFVASGISHVTDALGDLLRCAILIATGADRATACFDREPAEWRIQLMSMMDATGRGPMHLCILEFDSVYNSRPDAEGREAFKADCGALEFASAILVMAKAVITDFQKFDLREEPFPQAALNGLEAALNTYRER